jgi:hypothetical protein
MYVVPPMSIRTQASINFSDMLVAAQELHKSEFGSRSENCIRSIQRQL